MQAQGLGIWQKLGANAARGAAKVNQSSGGLLWCIGYRGGEFVVSAVTSDFSTRCGEPAAGRYVPKG